MSWELLESDREGRDRAPLALYTRGGEYMIRADGIELMNSVTHASEDALAGLAAQYVGQSGRVLIGGLGLGYTLSACLRTFRSAVEITVVEKSPAVLRWYEKYFRTKVLVGNADAAVKFVTADVVDFLPATARESYDVIIMDVDNGPAPLAAAGNARLYDLEGLSKIRLQLRPGGALLLWSGFDSAEFRKTAASSGFAVYVQTIALNSRHAHYIFVCERAASHAPEVATSQARSSPGR
jgi:spermidine synthase